MDTFSSMPFLSQVAIGVLCMMGIVYGTRWLGNGFLHFVRGGDRIVDTEYIPDNANTSPDAE